MPRTPDAAAHALTANDLLSGRIVWWTGSRWSEDFAHAQHVRDEAARAALAATALIEEGEDRVVGTLVIGLGPDGRPLGLREGRRLAGPSIELPGAVDAPPPALAA